jgi:hypothetical protein
LADVANTLTDVANTLTDVANTLTDVVSHVCVGECFGLFGRVAMSMTDLQFFE